MKILISIFILLTVVIKGCQLTPKEQYARARCYYAAGNYQEARKISSIAIKDSATYLDAYLLRAQINEKDDSLLLAISDYTTAFNLSVEQLQRSNILYMRGNVYYLALQDSMACQDWYYACENLGYSPACNQKRKFCKKQ